MNWGSISEKLELQNHVLDAHELFIETTFHTYYVPKLLSPLSLQPFKCWCPILFVEVTNCVVELMCVCKGFHGILNCIAGCAKIPGTICTDKIQGSSWAGCGISAGSPEDAWDRGEISGEFCISFQQLQPTFLKTHLIQWNNYCARILIKSWGLVD